MKHKAISIYDYTDYRRYLVDMLAALDRTQVDLAGHLDLSPSMMSQILRKGTRDLNPDKVDGVAAYFGLEPAETRYLGALVDLTNPSKFARADAWAHIQATQRKLAQEAPSDDLLAILTGLHVAAILELARCEGFVADPRWIAAQLEPKITPEQADRAIQALLACGALRPDPDRGLQASNSCTEMDSVAGDGQQSTTALALHLDAVQLAATAARRFDYKERQLSTLVTSLPEARWPELLARVHAFEASLLHWLESVQGEPANRVYTINVQVFPLSAYTDIEYDPAAEGDDDAPGGDPDASPPGAP